MKRIALAASLVLACHAPVTQLVVVVDTTLPAGSVDQLEIFVQRPSDLDGSMVASVRTSVPTSSGHGFPLSLTLVPDGDVRGELTLRVVASTHGAPVLERDVRVAFAAAESHQVPVLLRAQCQGIVCDAGNTCAETGCRSPELATLPAFPGCAPGTAVCVPDGGDPAGVACTDTRVDPGHCGSCAVACASEATCGQGFCSSSVVVDVASGGTHNCVAMQSGRVACWGRNDSYQLGIGTRAGNSGRAVAVTGTLRDVVRVAAGASHSCAMTSAGAVWCWGANLHGQLGDGTEQPRATPQQVTRLAMQHVRRIAAGGDVTCAIASADASTPGTLYCWGDNSHGQIQFPASAMRSIVHQPTAMNAGGLPVVDVAVGALHVCAIDSAATVHCWGDDSSGQLGDQPTTPGIASSAVAVLGLPAGSHATDVSAGAAHTCAVLDGSVWCWGSNAQRQLGNPVNTTSHAPPTQLFATGGVQSVAAGQAHTCALFVDHHAECWGSNASYQLGSGSHASQPDPTPGPIAYQPITMDLAELTAGDGHACALRGYGGVVCWGADESGELGDNGTSNRAHPLLVLGLP